MFHSATNYEEITFNREGGYCGRSVSWCGISLVSSQTDLANLYLRAGLKNLGTVFLITDAHIPDEKFLVLINDLLASGEIPDLFPEDEVENIVSSVRNEVRDHMVEGEYLKYKLQINDNQLCSCLWIHKLFLVIHCLLWFSFLHFKYFKYFI